MSGVGISVDNSGGDSVTLAGTPDYITLSGQIITRNKLDPADDLNTFASSVLLALVTDETGSGLLVFGTNPSLTAPTIAGGTHTAITNLAIRSTGAAFDLTLATDTVFTAGRTVTIRPGDAARILTLSGDATLTGTNTGDQTITLTGEVTGTGTGSFAATVANDAVTNAKLANMAVDTVKARATAGTGDPEDVAMTAAGRALMDDADAAAQRTTLGLGTIATVNSPVPVANGGTGASTLGDAGVLIGNGTSAIQVTGAGTSGQVLTSNGAGVDPTFQAAGSGSVTGVALRGSTFFETAGRFRLTTVSGGTSLFDDLGVTLSTSATATSSQKLQLIQGQNTEFAGSPVWSLLLTLLTTGSDFNVGVWYGLLTITGTALTLTEAHGGFKITRTASGTINLYATQADGTTENASASLATPASGNEIRLVAKVNTTVSIDYYYAIGTAAISAATNLTTNIPTAWQRFSAGITNLAVASNSAIILESFSYERAG